MIQIHHQHAHRRFLGAFYFLVEQRVEMAAVVETGEAVVDRKIDQFVVIFRFEAVSGEELDGVVADADLVAVVQFFPPNCFAVEISAIGRA